MTRGKSIFSVLKTIRKQVANAYIYATYDADLHSMLNSKH